MKWRVNLRPRFTVLELGEYMAADDGPRETILRDMRYERLARSFIYRQLRPAVAAFLASPTRDRGILARCRTRLEHDRNDASHPQKRENFNYELSALDAFERSLNALGGQGMNFEAAPPAAPLKIEGVVVSVQPTAHIRQRRPRGCDLVGALIVDLAKGTTPKTDETKARVASAMRYGTILVHQYVCATLSGEDSRPSPDHAIIYHAHRQERVCAPAAGRRLSRNIEAVCRNIARSWDGIQPPANFDPAFAMERR